MPATPALFIWPAGAAAVWPFGPVNAKPVQVLDHGFCKFGPRSLRIKVFVAKDQCAFMLKRALRGDPERSRVADVQQASG